LALQAVFDLAQARKKTPGIDVKRYVQRASTERLRAA
jgi:hypothetical protein